ncbi:hypothetical protein [Flavobacterium pedocola]
MKVKATLVLIFVLSLSMFSCVNKEKMDENNKKHTQEVELLVSKFYSDYNAQKNEELTNMFGEEFFTKTSKEELLKMFAGMNKKFGKVKKYEMGVWSKSYNSSSDGFKVEYEVEYEKSKTKERFLLLRDATSGKYKIVGYRIGSKDFLSE